MEIKISETEKSTAYVKHRNEQLRCPTAGYFKKLSPSSNNFTPLNEFWATLGMPHQDAYFALYKEAFLVVEEGMGLEETKDALTDVVRRLFEITDYNYLTEWTIQYGGIFYDKNIATEYNEEYPKRLTYIKTDYDKLVVLSMFFKMLVPVWGFFSGSAPNMDTDFKELHALSMMDTCGVHELEAMIRLKDYCEANVERSKKNIAPAILARHIGTTEIPKYFLAVAIVRRLSIGEIRNQSDTLIKLVSNFLKSKIEDLSRGVRDKRRSNNDLDEPESIAEKYRISQKTKDDEEVIAAEYIKRTETFVKTLNPEGNLKKVNTYKKAIANSPNFSIAGFHLIFIGLICDRIISTRICLKIERTVFLELIAITAGWLSDNGYQLIANLLLTSRFERDPNVMEMHSVSGFAFTSLTKENREALEEIYPHQQLDLHGKSKGNPGVDMIDMIVAEINSYDWDENMTMPQNIKNEIVELLIRREQEYANKYSRAS